jgi:hypothetical protein
MQVAGTVFFGGKSPFLQKKTSREKEVRKPGRLPDAPASVEHKMLHIIDDRSAGAVECI